MLSSYVVLFPNASCRSKMWPLENFVQLANALQVQYHVQIVIIGGTHKEDQERGTFLINHIIPYAVNLTGQLSLKSLGVLLQRSKLLISNDSGPVHVAASVGTPVISIFGRSDRGLSPERWRPLGNMSFFVHKYVGCIQCLAHNCDKEFLCLKSITSADILNLVSTKHLL